MFDSEKDLQAVTITDIAREIGVSKSTVSRVINGKGRIGKETRDRVMECVNRHNYSPNPMARGLAQKKTYNVAVVIPRDADKGEIPFFQNCLVGITEAVSQRGFDALLAVESGENLETLKRLVTNHKIDGVVLTRILENDPAVLYLKDEEVPFVVMGTSSDNSFGQVDCDQEKGCYDLTKTIISSNCRRMLVMGGEQRNLVNLRRWNGFYRACTDSGLEAGKVVWELNSQEGVFNVLPDLMKENPHCIVCMDDRICVWVIAWLKQNDYQIPEDIQVISFYDSAVLENNTPPVTALSVNVGAISSNAGNLLVDMVEGKTEPRTVSVQYEVKIRESSR